MPHSNVGLPKKYHGDKSLVYAQGRETQQCEHKGLQTVKTGCCEKTLCIPTYLPTEGREKGSRWRRPWPGPAVGEGKLRISRLHER